QLPAIVARRAGSIPVMAVVGRNDLSDAAQHAMGLATVHAIADHTEGSPTDDPALSAQLLQDLGRTMPLPVQPRKTRDHRCAARPSSPSTAKISCTLRPASEERLT